MKNLKLFVAPLLGATLLLTACGPKAMKVEDFKAKVGEKFNIDTIKKTYIGQKQHVTGKMEVTGSASVPIDETHEITGVELASGGNIYEFQFKEQRSAMIVSFDVLSTAFVDDIASYMAVYTVNYFISGDTYTIEGKAEAEGAKASMKFVYNKDLVITHSEVKGSGSGMSVNMQFNFKYEK